MHPEATDLRLFVGLLFFRIQSYFIIYSDLLFAVSGLSVVEIELDRAAHGICYVVDSVFFVWYSAEVYLIYGLSARSIDALPHPDMSIETLWASSNPVNP